VAIPAPIPSPVVKTAAPASVPSPAPSSSGNPDKSLYYVKGDKTALQDDLRRLFIRLYGDCKNPHASLMVMQAEKGIHNILGTHEVKEEQPIPGDDD
jgi:hypothetical protein